VVENSPVVKIGLAKRPKTVRQKGEIRTGSNQERAFRGSGWNVQRFIFKTRAIGKRKKGFQERGNPSLNVLLLKEGRTGSGRTGEA
jgi:hypothetical protein